MRGPSHGVVRIHLIFSRSVRAGTSNQPPAMVSNTSVIIRRPKKNKAKIADKNYNPADIRHLADFCVASFS
jgi:hypothetical protein